MENQSLKWLHTEMSNKIFVEEDIQNPNKPVRGVFGIFVKEKNKSKKCVYVGKSASIYSELFSSGEKHITALKNGIHTNSELKSAMADLDKTIIIEVLERVPYVFDNYYKDMQRLQTAKNHYIDKYQSMDQCLLQVPEGTVVSEDQWKKLKDI